MSVFPSLLLTMSSSSSLLSGRRIVEDVWEPVKLFIQLCVPENVSFYNDEAKNLKRQCIHPDIKHRLSNNKGQLHAMYLPISSSKIHHAVGYVTVHQVIYRPCPNMHQVLKFSAFCMDKTSSMLLAAVFKKHQ